MASGTARLVASSLVAQGKTGQVTSALSKDYNATAKKLKSVPTPNAKKRK